MVVKNLALIPTALWDKLPRLVTIASSVLFVEDYFLAFVLEKPRHNNREGRTQDFILSVVMRLGE